MVYLDIKKISIVSLLAILVLSSGCVQTGIHKDMKEYGYNNTVKVNPSVSDKEFVDRIELYLVRKINFKNTMIKMKSESLKTVIFNHDVDYSGWSTLTKRAGCEYCFANVQTEIVRRSKGEAIIKHSRFIPHKMPSGVRPRLRDTLANEIKRVLSGMNSGLEKTLNE